MNELRIVIVEDEPATARNLSHLLRTADNFIRISANLSSVDESVRWFAANPHNYDLVFMDIRLSDGVSFDIFKNAEILKPVIFVTAYNDYALQAFRNNGIDYVLKPFDEEDISRALQKYRSLTALRDHDGVNAKLVTSQLIDQLTQLTRSYKKSFLIHFREKLIPVEVSKIGWFYTANEVAYACTMDGKQLAVEFTMEQIEQQVDPQLFFRANRQFIINRTAILEANFYFNGRLSVKVKPDAPEKILISKARVPQFKAWMNS